MRGELVRSRKHFRLVLAGGPEAFARQKIGGHKKRVLLGTNPDWMRKPIRCGPFTLRKLRHKLTAHEIKTDVRADVHSRRGPELEKKRSCQPNKIVPMSRA